MPLVIIPDKFIDSISHQQFKNPVIASDQFVYEEEEILKWFETNKKNNIVPISPMTGRPFKNTNVIPADRTTEEMQEFFTKNNICSKEQFVKTIINDGKITEFLNPNFNYIGDYLYEKSNGGWTILHIASHRGNLEVINLLFDDHHKKYSINFLKEVNENGHTPLNFAIKGKHEEVAKTFLTHQPALINAVIHLNDRTALHIAVENGCLGLVNFLLEKGAEINKCDGKGWTSLHYAVFSGHVSLIKRFLAKFSDVNSLRDKQQRTLLHLAAMHSEKEPTEILLNAGAEINAKDEKDYTPLHNAVEKAVSQNKENNSVVKTLLEKGANPNIQTSNGDTPLHIATRSQKGFLIQLLLEHNADCEILNNKGEAPLNIFNLAPFLIKIIKKQKRQIEKLMSKTDETQDDETSEKLNDPSEEIQQEKK